MNKTESSDSNQKKESPEKRELENIPSSEQGKHKTKPRSSAQKSKRPKQKERTNFSISEKVILALIGAVATVITGLLVSPIVTCWAQPHTCEPPPPTITVPIISISSDVRDPNNNPIAMNSAPFKVSVQGTVSNADGLHIYLIVANKYHNYVQPIQPGVGRNVGNEFSNLCQLGQEGNPDSYGQQYTIYAVVTDKPYAPFAFFENESYIAKSKELIVTREPLPTPTLTP